MLKTLRQALADAGTAEFAWVLPGVTMPFLPGYLWIRHAGSALWRYTPVAEVIRAVDAVPGVH